ncbi:MAG TPA: right-handed parallel beta-helix repeat-containing protein, partial [Thermoplasmata archaeon]|nr:right-handed parallel beta-helix repeat-containing protein [Thermoplasmata archaeon]
MSATAIAVRNTTAYFVIRDVQEVGGWPYDGVDLYNVLHARVENSSLQANSEGLHAILAADLHLFNVSFPNNLDWAVILESTSAAWVESSLVDSFGSGIFLRSSEGIVVGNDTFSRTAFGITAVDSSSVLILGNLLSEGQESIQVYDTIAARVANNTIRTPSSVGIHLDGARAARVEGNEVTLAPTAVWAVLSTSLTIASNNLSFDGSGVELESVSTATVADNLMDVASGVALYLLGSEAVTL